MSGLARTAHRVMQSYVKTPGFTRALTLSIPRAEVKCNFTRGILITSKQMDSTEFLITKHSNMCSYAFKKTIHTKNKQEDNGGPSEKPHGEKELVEFVTEELVAERKAQKMNTLPTQLDGFKVAFDSAEVMLTKQINNELVRISFNVNHSVDSSENYGEVEDPEKNEFSELQSRPQFEVDLVRGDTTFSFTCSFMQNQQNDNEEELNDVFGIDEVTIFKGEWNDKVYAVAGDVLDGYLYDLLMNLLEEKGVSNTFATKLSALSTAYEHTSYINLLEGISKFTSGQH